MAIEYTGEVHLDSSRRRSDRDREELYGRLGIALLVVMTGDSTSTARLVDRMVQTRQRAAFASPESRTWTSVPPRWWIDTSTVDKRRALSAYDRERLLRYRPPAA
ncbi:hypothetical protein DDE18_02215 [Nocardioides gansuensis]|uniref:DUF559 domain-containing protein n=1 Tax=Nocardioides gansuensis TaxID=2138300 RepID=A0A2T8FFH5_9ACTN|nr:hypothetical protein [Nocardioides gansuensis]PVG84449.1 hypothetical protein DDE18_02215 [Nocardioides gansuensis]